MLCTCCQRRQLGQGKHNLPNKLCNDLHDAACFDYANTHTLNRRLFLAHQSNTKLVATQKDLTLVAHDLSVGQSFMQS